MSVVMGVGGGGGGGGGEVGRRGTMWQPASICNQRQKRNFSDVAFPLVCHQKTEDPTEIFHHERQTRCSF